jgi:hypothetical protein
MDKINSIDGINKYYCSECLKYHIRKYRYKINKLGNSIKTKDTPFFNHKHFANKLTPSELFNRQFKANWNNYSIKSHKKTYNSIKQ